MIETGKTISSNVFRLSTHSDMTMKTQIELFNSFDILITPHSSSNVNNMFTKSSTVVIELLHVKFKSALSNRHWEWIGDKYIQSTGHRMSETNVVPKCNPQKKIWDCNLSVNTTVLASALMEARSFLCDVKS